jgi:hypothetical protein
MMNEPPVNRKLSRRTFAALAVGGFTAAASRALATEAAPGSDITFDGLPGDFPSHHKYRVHPYLQVVARLQALGEQRAKQRLLELARQAGATLDHELAAVILCRMLFQAKAGGGFRRPGIGEASLLGDTGPKEWPLEPIELIDGIPFLITWGYSLEGFAEPPDKYVRYCIQNCVWRPYRYRAHTAAEKQETLRRLLADRRWKRPLQPEERGFLSGQIT